MDGVRRDRRDGAAHLGMGARSADVREHRRDRPRLPRRGGRGLDGRDRRGRHGQLQLPLGQTRHNVQFISKQPTSCTQTAGDMWQPSPPLPWYMQGPGWAGNCRFDEPGTYEFRSGLNYAMTGTVIVLEHTDADADADPDADADADADADGDSHGDADADSDADADGDSHGDADGDSHGDADRRPRRPRPPRRRRRRPPRRRRPRPARGPRSTRTTRRRRTSGTGSRIARAAIQADNSVTIAAGGTVDFAAPVGGGTLPHNVVFNTNPTSCVQTAGSVLGRRAAAADRRPADGLGRQLHLRDAGHVHVLLLDAPRGDDGQRHRHGRRRADARRRRRPRRPRRRRSRRATPRRRRSPRRGRRSTSRRRRR